MKHEAERQHEAPRQAATNDDAREFAQAFLTGALPVAVRRGRAGDVTPQSPARPHRGRPRAAAPDPGRIFPNSVERFFLTVCAPQGAARGKTYTGAPLTLSDGAEAHARAAMRRRFAAQGGALGIARALRGPLALREALGASLTEMAALLAQYGAPHYARATLSAWERPERGRRLARKYHMTPIARAAYWHAARDLVTLASGGALELAGNTGTGAGRWRVRARATCGTCARPFTLTRRNLRNCGHCRARARRRNA